MIKQIKNKLTKKNKRGFTLIELIVVIAIVAVLAAIGIPAIAGQVSKSNLATAKSNARLVASTAQQLITESEVAGSPANPAQATVASKCGVDNATITDYNIAGSGTAADPYVCNLVECTVGGQVYKWVRT